MLGPFHKQNGQNPILDAKVNTTFNCPVRRELVRWEEKYVFNPATVVRNNKVYMLYRAEDIVLLGSMPVPRGWAGAGRQH